MGAEEEIQEVIQNRLFSQGKKKILSHRARGLVESDRVPRQFFNTLRVIRHVSCDYQEASVPPFSTLSAFPTFVLTISHISFHFPPICFKFSYVMNTGVSICESFLWSVSWPGGVGVWGCGGASHSSRVSLGFLTAQSKA